MSFRRVALAEYRSNSALTNGGSANASDSDTPRGTSGGFPVIPRGGVRHWSPARVSKALVANQVTASEPAGICGFGLSWLVSDAALANSVLRALSASR